MTGQTYILADPNTGEIRYVGFTTRTAAQRLKGHMAGRFKAAWPKPWPVECNFDAWAGDLALKGQCPCAIVIATCNVERSAYFALKKSGARLFNKQIPPKLNDGEQA